MSCPSIPMDGPANLRDHLRLEVPNRVNHIIRVTLYVERGKGSRRVNYYMIAV